MSEDQEAEQDAGANYVGICIALGAGLGTALGAAWGNISIGIVFGAGAGVVIGAVMSQAKKKDPG